MAAGGGSGHLGEHYWAIPYFNRVKCWLGVIFLTSSSSRVQVRAAVQSRRLGHVFAPVWRTASGALFGFRAIMRFPDGTGPSAAAAAAREAGDLAALGELSLLSAMRVSWSLAGSLLVDVWPTEDFLCRVPQATALRKTTDVLAELAITAEVSAGALRHTATHLREQGFALALAGEDTAALCDAAETLRPEVLRLQAPLREGPEATALLSAARKLGALVLGDGVDRPGQVAELRLLGCDLVEGPHLGRPAPAGVCTPARVSLSWPREASL